MKTVIELPATLSALAEHLSKSEGISVKPKWVTVEPYGAGDAIYDSRIDWYTYVVSIKGDAVGFTNGPVE